MRQLDHPNVVRLIDFSESRQYYYIVLELCPGGELFHQIVRLTYFSEELSRHVIVQVAKALLYLHEDKGVVHRWVVCMFLRLASANMTSVISNQKIFSSIPSPSFLPRTPSHELPKMKTRQTKVNLFSALVLVGLVRSRSPILVFPRLSGTRRP